MASQMDALMFSYTERRNGKHRLKCVAPQFSLSEDRGSQKSLSGSRTKHKMMREPAASFVRVSRRLSR